MQPTDAIIYEAAHRETEFIKLPLDYQTSGLRPQGIGLVVPFDFALDDEVWRWMPAGTPLYVARTAYEENTAITTDLAQSISDARVLVPALHSLVMAKPSAVAYACTMASFINGNAGELLLREAMELASDRHAVTTSGAMLAAVQALGIRRIAIATPYNKELTERLVVFLEAAGVMVTKAGYLGSEGDIMHIGYEVVRDMVRHIDSDEAEAVFFACTNLRTFDLIEDLERELGKPVLSANQVTIWAALRAANLPLPRINQRLFMLQ